MKLLSRFWLLLILLAGFAYRLYRLGASSLWYDETVSLYLARLDLAALTRHTAGDIHPPLYYYLLHFWGQLAGWSEFSAAFFSLCFGVLLIALVYRVARDWFNARLALVASFLVAISPYNLWYSQEVRMYTLGAVLGLASVWLFARMLRETTDDRRQTTDDRPQTADSRWRIANSNTRPASRLTSLVMRALRHHASLIAYVVVSALGLYTLYYFVFLLVFENLVALYWVFRHSPFAIRHLPSSIRNPQSAIRTWLLSQLSIALLFLPWLPIAIRQATDPPVPPWRAFIPLPDVLLETFSALALGQSVEPRETWWVLAIVAVVIVVALLPDNRRQRTEHRQQTADDRPLSTVHHPLFLLGYTFLPLALIYAFSLWKPLYHVRYMFIYAPAFYILLAIGIWRIANSKWRVANLELRITNYELRITKIAVYAILLLLALTSLYSANSFWFSPRYADDDLRGAVRYLSERWRPGDAILINAGYTYPAFVYYSDLPIAWRGRLTNYQLLPPGDGAVVLQTGSIGGAANLGWGSPDSDFYATTADETRAALDRAFTAHPRVWMLRLYDTVVDPDGVIRDYLAMRGRIIDDAVFAGEANARVQGYLTTRAPLTTLPSSLIRREVVLGNRIALLGFEANAATARAGAPFDFTLYWQAREPLNVDARVYIGLFAEDGRVIAASEEMPLGNALGTSRWARGEVYREPARLMIPANVPPGNYSVRIVLFDPFTREPLIADVGEGIVDKSQIGLMTVRVEK